MITDVPAGRAERDARIAEVEQRLRRMGDEERWLELKVARRWIADRKTEEEDKRKWELVVAAMASIYMPVRYRVVRGEE